MVVRGRLDEDGVGQKVRLGQIDAVSLRVTTRATAFRSHGFSFLLRWRSQRTGLLSRRGAGAEAASVRAASSGLPSGISQKVTASGHSIASRF